MEPIRIIALTGPTAAGKTALALRLARRLDAEIVSCDSRAVYKGLPTLTAVPQENERKGIAYHLVDFLEPKERWNASVYMREARAVLADILQRKPYAIIAGGSGLYFRALREGLSPLPAGDPPLRRELESLLKREGRQALAQRLIQEDPETARRVDLKNPRRVIRALELLKLLGGPVSPKLGRRSPLPWPCLTFYLSWPRQEIKQRIEARARAGFEQRAAEVAQLFKQYGPEAPAWEALMAEPIHRFLMGEISREQAISECARRDAAYAKKQETWFKKERDMIRIEMKEPNALENAEKAILRLFP